MEKYVSVELEIIAIEGEDVIAASNPQPTPKPGPIELPIIPFGPNH
ncbi:MAG: hypothetical protein IKD69_13110 [Solobacterium sp.]|nr:hypothetical protein [Solobacterium sp.]